MDEEQKFGVSVKEKLKQMKVNVDTLTMSATPIRALSSSRFHGSPRPQFAQHASGQPHPIVTNVKHIRRRSSGRGIPIFELSRNGQVFFVSNRIENLTELKTR